MPRAVVPILLEPLIASFCRAYPEVEVEIAASDELVDIAAGGFDAGIRFGQLIAADMVAIRLTPPFRLLVVGHPDYLARAAAPRGRTICATTRACVSGGPTARSPCGSSTTTAVASKSRCRGH